MSRVLVVDDEESVREVLKTFLNERGYVVAEAASGPLAIASMDSFRPDIVLLDIRMPGMDGIEVLQRLKERRKDIPVLMVTATDDEDIARQAIRLGASDYITKPFSFAQLETNLMVHLLLDDKCDG